LLTDVPVFSIGIGLVLSPPRASPHDAVEVDRGRTAIKRHRCSRPVALALADGIITGETSFFDYGCGYGADVEYLKGRKISATGWDLRRSPKSTRPRLAEVTHLM